MVKRIPTTAAGLRALYAFVNSTDTTRADEIRNTGAGGAQKGYHALAETTRKALAALAGVA